ncbi:hypothetical protein HY642_04640 [Candidatus Woesearchaeota archaeon]|nr:hypothetical protein [Candidatus Woesearchaeota archaeon]
MVPLEVEFNLSKFGSYNADLALEDTLFYKTRSYTWEGKLITGLELTPEGESLATSAIQRKIQTILTPGELSQLQELVSSLSVLRADQVSEEEHAELLVDEEDRHKLVRRINTVHIDLLDLYRASMNLPSDDPTTLRFAALIEYCYNLTKYLREKRFKDVEEAKYDYEANMFDYYFLHILEKTVIPFLQTQLALPVKDAVRINKYYQYFVNAVRSKYAFSIDNPNLRELVA